MSFTLAHLSDPHLPPLPAPKLRELAGKRALGYLNWTRNRHKYHRREVLDALVSDLKSQSPGHIAITGDLVNLALEAEFAPSLKWLECIGAADRVTVIPGNHDAYVGATRHHFQQAWASYIASDEPTCSNAAFPFVRRRGPLALVSLSSAVPTPPFMATGTLGREQLDELERVLVRLSAEQLFRVLLVHHPLRSDSRAKRLTDSAALIALIKQHGVELILHGHDHVHSLLWIKGPTREIPAIGIPSASALPHGRYPGAAYNLFTVESSADGWRCQQTVRGLNEKLQISELKRTQLF
jgi:3',5'-cyclic AMP phosphodiesterase CpdA